MELNLSINYIYPSQNGASPFWWKETTIIEEIIADFLNSNLLDVQFFLANDEFKKTTEIYSITSYYRKFIDKNGCLFSLSKDTHTDSNYIDFYCSDDVIGIDLFVNFDSKLDQLEIMQQFVSRIYNQHKNSILLGPSIVAKIHGVDYPRYRPIRDYKGLNENGLINFILPEYYSSDKNLVDREDLKLLTAFLPANVSKKDLNGLYAIQWIDIIKDERKIRQALMDREEFIYENLKLHPIDEFNEFGDKQLFGISDLPAAPDGENFFNYYNNNNGMVFKLLTLTSDFKIEGETLNKLKEYLFTRKLYTGDPLNNIALIVPSRKAATTIESDALAIGVYKVLYLDNDTNIWDMHPKGDWRN